MSNNDRQVKKQLDRVLRSRAQYRSAQQEAPRLSKVAGTEFNTLKKVLRKET